MDGYISSDGSHGTAASVANPVVLTCHNLGFNQTKALMSIDQELQTPSDQRLFAIANAMHSGYTVERIWELTQIDKWFLKKNSLGLPISGS